GRLELLSAVDILIQCVDALDAALAKGVIHRDIKPSNLMLDQNQRIKIVDFGLARLYEVGWQVAQPSGIFGTPDYMAPEQAQFGKVDHRADIYSLGITLYLLLYGKLPFSSRSPIEMVVKHATDPFPEYDPLGGAVPREAYQIIEKMTCKSPEDRYQDYASCRQDLVSLREEIFSSTGVLLPQVENIAPSPIWRTEDYFEILSALYVSPRSGVLTIRSGMQSLLFIVENRHILFQESQDAEATIWKLLVEAGYIQKTDIPPPGSDFRDSLMHFLINRSFGFEDLKKVYRQYLKTLVLNAGRWDGVECEFHAGEVHNDDIEGLFIGDALLDLAREVIPFEVLQEYFQNDRYLARIRESDHILTALSLTPEESFIASRIEPGQGISMEELCLMTGFEEEKVVRLVYVLLRIGVCQWKNAPEKRHAAAKIERQKKEEAESDPYKRIAEQFFELARREFDQGKFWRVTELCKQAIRNDASQGKYYHLMAMAFAHHPRFADDAEQCFNKAIELEPGEAEYHLSHARFLLKQGQHQRAGAEINRALEIDPQNSSAEELRQELGDPSA
ncbi:MAG TPA: protein kinase, partial [Acidobacteriota bacterium]|nr:protein kinase [Acidobacteriota bacterium]